MKFIRLGSTDEYETNAILLHCISHAMSRSENKNQTKLKYRQAGY